MFAFIAFVKTNILKTNNIGDLMNQLPQLQNGVIKFSAR